MHARALRETSASTTVRRRYEYELRKLLERIHILDGFAKIFNDLDTAIQIIRDSKDRKQAAEGLIEYFLIDQIQADGHPRDDALSAGLDGDQEDPRPTPQGEEGARPARSARSSATTDKLKDCVRGELELTELAKEHGDARRTRHRRRATARTRSRSRTTTSSSTRISSSWSRRAAG